MLRFIKSGRVVPAFAFLLGCFVGMPASADLFTFSTGSPNGLIGTASRPGVGAFEIESADDFILSQTTLINHITFTGLLVGGTLANIDPSQLVLEMYRVFPNDSDVGRTSGPPT